MNPRSALPHRTRTTQPSAPGALPPYDLYPTERALFITFNVQGACQAFPLACLAEATLAPGNALITLSFGNATILIRGQALAELFEAILLAKVRVVRPGSGAICTVSSIEQTDLRFS